MGIKMITDCAYTRKHIIEQIIGNQESCLDTLEAVFRTLGTLHLHEEQIRNMRQSLKLILSTESTFEFDSV
jgi:hypothetical protein